MTKNQVEEFLYKFECTIKLSFESKYSKDFVAGEILGLKEAAVILLCTKEEE